MHNIFNKYSLISNYFILIETTLKVDQFNKPWVKTESNFSGCKVFCFCYFYSPKQCFKS